MARAIELNGLGVAAAALLALAGGSGANAADSAKAQVVSLYGDKGVPNISGLWLGTATGVPGTQPKTPDGRPQTYWAPWPPPLTPAYQKRADERIAAQAAGRAIGDNGARCLPFGMPWGFISKVYQDEIVQTPGAVTILVFNTFPL
jgi:hypothetical protein